MRPFFDHTRWLTVFGLFALVPFICRAQALQTPKPKDKLSPQPAIPAILSAFDRYEVVGMQKPTA